MNSTSNAGKSGPAPGPNREPQRDGNHQGRGEGRQGKAKAPVRSLGDDLDEYLASDIYPALFDRLDAAFPEFGWVKQGGDWLATTWPAGFPYAVNDPRADRLMVYADRP